MTRRGKEQFFENKICPLYTMVFSYLYAQLKNKEQAEDLVQQTMEKAWINFDQLRDKEKYKQWTMQIAHNEIRQYFRNDKFRHLQVVDINDSDEEKLEIRDESAEEEIYKVLNQEAMIELFYGLKEVYKSIIVLHLLEGFTFEEVAEVIEMNPNTVRGNYRRGLALVRQNYLNLQKE